MRKGYLFTNKETQDIFMILSNARLKCTGKFQTLANKYYERLQKEILNFMEIERDDPEN